MYPVQRIDRVQKKIFESGVRRAPNQSSVFVRPKAVNVQNFQRSYERYSALARAEALTGDRIVAENYFQHAEHYFRVMRENQN
jgi:Domain of unknown function (DUF4167)